MAREDDPPPDGRLRRRAALAAVGLLAGCAGVGGRGRPGGGQGWSEAPSRAVPLADGVWLLPGSGGEATPSNRGRIGNAGFIVGSRGVLAIDTGTSRRHGEALLAAIRATTDRPLRQAVVTHVRPEFLFGAGAFRAVGVPLAMHIRAAELMAARCERCLQQLRAALGEAEMAGTTMWQPDLRFEGPHEIDLGDRRVRVLAAGRASGPGDVALLDLQSGVLFSGGLVEHRRIPDIQDADLGDWHAGLAALRAAGPRIVVPAHGAPGDADLIDRTEAYLSALEARLQALFAAGAALSVVPDQAVLPAFADWDQAATIHRRNASLLFLRLERAQLER